MHQSKRPYNGSQPEITSYFSSSATYHSSSSYPAEQPRTSLPQLPPAIQSNLINVGMRVRKSVPEGYKTGTYSAFNLFSESTTASPTASTSSAMTTKSRTRPRAGARELTPFCGIMKIGGMETQQWENSNSWDPYATSSSEDEDNVPSLSQGSTVSNFSFGATSPSASNKRRFFDEEESGTEEFVGMGGSPGGLGPRPLAVPRRRKYNGFSTASPGGGKMMVFGGSITSGEVQEKENRTLVHVAGQDVDFEDAEFLDYGLVSDRGFGEVEMSG